MHLEGYSGIVRCDRANGKPAGIVDQAATLATTERFATPPA
jgi:hypothetical protein